MNVRKARDIHGEGEHAREQGDFLKALQLIEEATIAYSQENDPVGFAEIQGSRFLTLRHLYEKTGDASFLVLAKYSAKASSELAEKSGIPSAIALPFFNLAKAHETLGELPAAIEAYKKAVSSQEAASEVHYARPAVLFDMKVHLYVCEYKNGDKSALEKADEALSDLEADQKEPKYTKDVWASGGHMKIAEALKADDPEKAKIHLDKAKEIIDSNPDLVLRKGQWEKLAKSFV